ncbi:MAG: hypothetical protein KAU03_07115, partial [Candidatus Altiarchaeales archaeon]|nr:hypothetical protein [Candidatus Altiarchaeales archaeon]
MWKKGGLKKMETNEKLRMLKVGVVVLSMILLIDQSIAFDENNKVVCSQFQGGYDNMRMLFSRIEEDVMYESPTHNMEEKIVVDPSKVSYQDSRLNLGDSSVSYVIDVDNIPAETLIRLETKFLIDPEYRGKMLIFGEEYYVSNIKGLVDEVYLKKGKILTDISSEGYTSEYRGYRFKIDHLIYSGEYTVAGILVTIEKPDGTEVQRQISRVANAIIDDLEIAGVYAEAAAGVETASILVYDRSKEITLRAGEDMVIDGEPKKNWKVNFEVITKKGDDWINEQNDPVEIGTTGYIYVLDGQRLLNKIIITYTGDKILKTGESLELPSKYRLKVGDEGNLYIEGGTNSCDELSSLRGYPTAKETISGEPSSGAPLIPDNSMWIIIALVLIIFIV